MPTKPMEPAAATLAPQAAATARMTIRFSRCNRNAHVEGGSVAQNQRIQPTGDEGNDGKHDDDERQGGEHLGGSCPAERAERPEGNVTQRPIVGDEDHQAGQRAADCRKPQYRPE